MRNMKVIQSQADLAPIAFDVGFVPERLALTRNGMFGLCTETGGSRIGLFVFVDLPQDIHNDGGMGVSQSKVVYLSAVDVRGGLPMVQVLRPNGTTELRLLRLGDRVDADHVIVLTGLVGGERVKRSPGR